MCSCFVAERVWCSTTSLCVHELRHCVRGWPQMTSPPPPFICSVPVFVPVKLASYRCLQSSVCVTTMRLPFERVTSINMCSDQTSNSLISVHKCHPWIGNADTHNTWKIYNRVAFTHLLHRMSQKRTYWNKYGLRPSRTITAEGLEDKWVHQLQRHHWV